MRSASSPQKRESSPPCGQFQRIAPAAASRTTGGATRLFSANSLFTPVVSTDSRTGTAFKPAAEPERPFCHPKCLRNRRNRWTCQCTDCADSRLRSSSQRCTRGCTRAQENKSVTRIDECAPRFGMTVTVPTKIGCSGSSVSSKPSSCRSVDSTVQSLCARATSVTHSVIAPLRRSGHVLPATIGRVDIRHFTEL